MEAEIILSIVVAVSTVIYTIINAMMWWESRETRLQKITPFIVAYIKSGDSMIWTNLHIKNIGEGYAKNVSFNVISDYKRFDKDDFYLSKISAIRNGINSFPPDYELKYSLKASNEILDSDNIEIEIIYYRSDNKRYKDKFKIRLNDIADQNYSAPPESFLGQISHYLKEINTAIKNLKK